jgi:predicted metal-dependent enzyme (double-stranded beta helix superfamily)
MLAMTRSAFDLDRFIADCRDALAEDPPQKAVREILARALSDPAAVRDALGQPSRAQVQKLHVATDLVILNAVWAPGMTIMPHNHNMWAVIGLYDGREDNIVWRRIKDEAGGRVEAAGAKSLSTGDCATLGHDIIHSVTNPIARFSGAIHIYGGDFFNAPRSEWDPETLLEGPYSVEKTVRIFEDANRRHSGA